MSLMNQHCIQKFLQRELLLLRSASVRGCRPEERKAFVLWLHKIKPYVLVTAMMQLSFTLRPSHATTLLWVPSCLRPQHSILRTHWALFCDHAQGILGLLQDWAHSFSPDCAKKAQVIQTVTVATLQRETYSNAFVATEVKACAPF